MSKENLADNILLKYDLETLARAVDGLIMGDDTESPSVQKAFKVMKKHKFWDKDGFWIGDDE